MNTNEYMKQYMKKYIAESATIICTECEGHYKSYRRYRHIKSKKHNAVKDTTVIKLQDRIKELEHLLIEIKL